MLITVDDKLEKVLTDSEKEAVRYINEHASEIVSMPLNQIAIRSFTSTATISRAVRKCGFSGVSELRLKAAGISAASSPLRVNEILEKSYIECTRTIENININNIIKVANYIKTSRRIIVLARGITRLVAEEFVVHLQLQGYNAILISDSQIMKKIGTVAQAKDTLIVISAHNSTPEFEIALKDSKAIGCKNITCTCKSQTPLEAFADIQIVGYSLPIVPGNNYNGSSRIPLLIITRTILEYLGS